MKHLLLVLTATSIALLAALTNAAQVGNAMEYGSTTVISGALSGAGSSTGNGVFIDEDTLPYTGLSIAETEQFNIPGFALTTVTREIVYLGILTGNTWASSGLNLVTTTACTGDAFLCSFFRLGSYPDTNSHFSTDILTGGDWLSTRSIGGALLTTQNTLSPVPLPAAAWLFGSALLGLGAIKRRKAA